MIKILIGIVIGSVLVGITNASWDNVKIKVEDSGIKAYGYYEKGNVWNRIRVDIDGRVVCASTYP